MLSHKTFVFNPFQENTYVLWNDAMEAVIIDPGCYDASEHLKLINFVSEKDLKVIAIWLTHAHIDHVLGLQFCIDKWEIPYYLHQAEVSQLKAVEVYAPNYGFNDFKGIQEEGSVFDLSDVFIGKETFKVLFVPGHAPGHVAFFHEETGQIWAGDVLFRQSIGRTDLPGGNFEILKNSILTKLYTLHENTIVYPGHGPKTEIGFEKKYNPFVSI